VRLVIYHHRRSTVSTREQPASAALDHPAAPSTFVAALESAADV
jgi:hypothetical protein